MSLVATLTLFAFLPLGLVMFPLLPPARRALLIIFIGSALFLPMAAVKLPGLIYTKATAASLAALIGILIFDSRSLGSFRLHWADLPMLVWCTVPFASSMSNGLGVYDGVWTVTERLCLWGIPYFVGRVYFSSHRDISALAYAIVIGGLLYVPLCLFEIKMSPQLHNLVYGFQQHAFTQTKRFGGWRPMVFMQHGLMVGMWMSAASLVGIWLWRSGALQRIRGLPVTLFLIPLLITTVLCKSAGSLILLGVGVLLLFVIRRKAIAIPVYILLAVAPCYIGLRSTGIWSGDRLVKVTNSSIGDDRAQSLEYRLTNEDLLADYALKRPLFGWGGWGRARPTDDNGAFFGVTDGLWIIALGDNGIVGITSLTAALLLPTWLLVRKYPVRLWRTSEYAAPAAIGIILTMWMLDNLMNAMINQVYIVCAGALTGFVARPVATMTSPRRSQGETVRVRRLFRRRLVAPLASGGKEIPPDHRRIPSNREAAGTNAGVPPLGGQ